MMYRKILVPLDGSQESAKALDAVNEMHLPGAEVVLLHVIPPMKTLGEDEHRVLAASREEAERAIAMDYLIPPLLPLVQREHLILGAELEEAERAAAMSRLRAAAAEHIGPLERWRCAVVVARSVVQGIVEFALREEVDLIAMYTHDRKGLAKLIKGSIAEKVLRSVPPDAPIEVQVFRPREFAARPQKP